MLTKKRPAIRGSRGGAFGDVAGEGAAAGPAYGSTRWMPILFAVRIFDAAS